MRLRQLVALVQLLDPLVQILGDFFVLHRRRRRYPLAARCRLFPGTRWLAGKRRPLSHTSYSDHTLENPRPSSKLNSAQKLQHSKITPHTAADTEFLLRFAENMTQTIHTNDDGADKNFPILLIFRLAQILPHKCTLRLNTARKSRSRCVRLIIWSLPLARIRTFLLVCPFGFP